jgi:Bax protein
VAVILEPVLLRGRRNAIHDATILLAETLIAALLALPMFAQVKPTDEIVPCRNSKEVFALFDRLGYTQKAWHSGIREIPRVYLADLPDTWRDRSVKDLSPQDKKRLFFRVIAPIVLRINELILEDRVRANELTERLTQGQRVTPDDQVWLTKLAVKYKVLESTSERLDRNAFAELLMRVDVIPPSLALAQAANESGWGTSRFAEQGNALFGQWSWGTGLKPTEQRTSEFGDRRIAAFGSTAQAAYSYALNLNTEHAYRDFRLKRAVLRRQKQRISGTLLSETLVHYSERGQAYVNDLEALIRLNRLDAVDDAYLRRMAVIHIVPAGTGPN